MLIKALAHLELKGILHGDVKLLNIVRIQQLATSTIKLIDMDAIATLNESGFVGAKFSSGVLPPEMFEVLDGDGVDKFTSYWAKACPQQSELWRKIEPRWSRSGDAIVVKTWSVCVDFPFALIVVCDDVFPTGATLNSRAAKRLTTDNYPMIAYKPQFRTIYGPLGQLHTSYCAERHCCRSIATTIWLQLRTTSKSHSGTWQCSAENLTISCRPNRCSLLPSKSDGRRSICCRGCYNHVPRTVLRALRKF